MSAVLVLTPNPAQEISYVVDRQRLGDTQRVLRVTTRPGGAGNNVARVLRALDVPVSTIQPLGGDTGAYVHSALGRLLIPVHAIRVRESTRRSVTVTDAVASPTRFEERGPVLAPEEWTALSRVLHARLPEATTLVISGILTPGADPEVVGDWVRLARTHGVRSVVDVAGEALLAAARAGADLLTPNATEAMGATGTDSPEGAADALRLCGAHAVVLSRGEAGLIGFTGGGTRSVAAVPHILGTPGGAGDAVTAGLVRALEAGDDLLEALVMSSALGAAAALSPLAGELDPTDVRRFSMLLGRTETTS